MLGNFPFGVLKNPRDQPMQMYSTLEVRSGRAVMFNSKLKKEIQQLREDLMSVEQVKSSLDSEMLVLQLDPHGRIESVNSNFEKEMLYSAGQLIGRNIEEIVPPHVKELDFYHRMKGAITRGEHLNGAFRLLRGNGEEAWLRSILQPVKSSDGRIKHFSMHSSDLTRTIEASREHESLIKALMRSTALIEFNLQGEVLTANDRFLNAMGYTLEQVRGKPHRMFCEPEEANSPAYQAFWDKLRRGEFVADRFKRVDAHGRTVWLEASYNPIIDAHDVLYKVVKFATVITDQVNQKSPSPRLRTSPTTPRWVPTPVPARPLRWSPRPSMSCAVWKAPCRMPPRASRRWTPSPG